MLLNTGTEDIAHVEMPTTAVSLNPEDASAEVKEVFTKSSGAVVAVMGGIDVRHFFSWFG